MPTSKHGLRFVDAESRSCVLKRD